MHSIYTYHIPLVCMLEFSVKSHKSLNRGTCVCVCMCQYNICLSSIIIERYVAQSFGNLMKTSLMMVLSHILNASISLKLINRAHCRIRVTDTWNVSIFTYIRSLFHGCICSHLVKPFFDVCLMADLLAYFNFNLSLCVGLVFWCHTPYRKYVPFFLPWTVYFDIRWKLCRMEKKVLFVANMLTLHVEIQ